MSVDGHISEQMIEHLRQVSPRIQWFSKNPALDFSRPSVCQPHILHSKIGGTALSLIFRVEEELSANLAATEVIMKGLAVRLFDVERSNCPSTNGV
jgi:hypothetical protein